MKLKLCAVLVSLAFAVPAVRATTVSTLTLTEQNSTITADLNGTSVPITVTGPSDHWTVEFPDGYSISQLSLVVFPEPENNHLANDILITQHGNGTTQHAFLLWDSDAVPLDSATSVNAGLVVTLPTGGPANLVFKDVDDNPGSSVPDASSTASLLVLAGLGMIGMRHVGNFRKSSAR